MADAVSSSDPGLAIHDGGHVVRLKWHRMKRRIGDIPFTASILAEAFALGASSEIDLRVTGEGGFAVLHDATLDRETTGRGAVAAMPDQALRDFYMRTPDGEPTREPLLLLDDLAALAGREAAAGTLVQLDLKEEAVAITDRVVQRFAATLAPVADRFILSGGDLVAVRRLADAVPGLAAGYDPCDPAVIAPLQTAEDFARFTDAAIAASGTMAMIYLAYPLVLKADANGFDMIGAFHDAGKRVDAWTLNTMHPDAVASLSRLVALRADQITTDEPLRLAALYANRDTSQG